MKTLEQIKSAGGVLRRFGNWYIEINLNTGGVNANGHMIVLYGRTVAPWATDTPESMPYSVKRWLDVNGYELEKLQRKLRGEL